VFPKQTITTLPVGSDRSTEAHPTTPSARVGVTENWVCSLRDQDAQHTTHKTTCMLPDQKHLLGELDLRIDPGSSNTSLLLPDLAVMKLAALLERDTLSTAWERDH